MTEWRSSVMDQEQWARFQEQYEELFASMRAPEDMALFSQSGPGEDEHTVLIPSAKSEVVERLSGTQWTDHANPAATKWTLLVANAGAPERFGIRLGSY